MGEERCINFSFPAIETNFNDQNWYSNDREQALLFEGTTGKKIFQILCRYRLCHTIVGKTMYRTFLQVDIYLQCGPL